MRKLFIVLFMLFGVYEFSEAQGLNKFTVAKTRPANATAYAAGDIVTGTDSSVFVFSTSAFSAGQVVSAHLEADTANAANGTFRLFLYADSTGLGKIDDNAPNTRTVRPLGVIDFTLATTGVGTAARALNIVTPSSPLVYYTGGTGATGLYGVLVATGAYVPKVSGVITLVLVVKQL